MVWIIRERAREIRLFSEYRQKGLRIHWHPLGKSRTSIKRPRRWSLTTQLFLLWSSKIISDNHNKKATAMSTLKRYIVFCSLIYSFRTNLIALIYSTFHLLCFSPFPSTRTAERKETALHLELRLIKWKTREWSLPSQSSPLFAFQ